jgi:hypothetical protein
MPRESGLLKRGDPVLGIFFLVDQFDDKCEIMIRIRISMPRMILT